MVQLQFSRKKKTYNAVKNSGDRNNLNSTGIADDTTIPRLNSPSTNKGGDPFLPASVGNVGQ
ncbi:MAG: hypothetical protein RUMPE_01313 [Eubacteriales bacterium SKADARSKE-1]|nr:hypothetical protein [Eubacteriales bacterium SKADARSKE-1]